MARLARVVVLGYPHHITQRGNRRYIVDIAGLKSGVKKASVAILAAIYQCAGQNNEISGQEIKTLPL